MSKSPSKKETHEMLVEMGFEPNYIQRAFKVYEKNYGHSYCVKVITDIIARLQAKDKTKKAKAKNQQQQPKQSPNVPNQVQHASADEHRASPQQAARFQVKELVMFQGQEAQVMRILNDQYEITFPACNYIMHRKKALVSGQKLQKKRGACNAKQVAKSSHPGHKNRNQVTSLTTNHKHVDPTHPQAAPPTLRRALHPAPSSKRQFSFSKQSRGRSGHLQWDENRNAITEMKTEVRSQFDRIIARLDRMASEMRIMQPQLARVLSGEAVDQNQDEGHAEVRMWLSETVRLAQYADVLIENGFDDLQSMQDIDRDILKEMKIDKIGHQVKLLRCARKLQLRTSINQSAEPGAAGDEGAQFTYQ